MAMTFADAYELAKPYTLLPEHRCQLLHELSGQVPDGSFAELGVYLGGSAMLLRAASESRTIHLFDTFRGHPKPSGIDTADHPEGRFNETSASLVKDRVASLSGGETVLWPGEFGEGPVFDQRLAFVHLDADLHESTLWGLTRFEPSLVAGGVIVLDDFGDNRTPGVTLAVFQYLIGRPHLSLTVPTLGQAVIRKSHDRV